jgi:hypothetical protein
MQEHQPLCLTNWSFEEKRDEQDSTRSGNSSTRPRRKSACGDGLEDDVAVFNSIAIFYLSPPFTRTTRVLSNQLESAFEPALLTIATSFIATSAASAELELTSPTPSFRCLTSWKGWWSGPGTPISGSTWEVMDLKKLVLGEGKYITVRRYNNIPNKAETMLPRRGPHPAKMVLLVYSTKHALSSPTNFT